MLGIGEDDVPLRALSLFPLPIHQEVSQLEHGASDEPSNDRKALEACSSFVDGNANCGILLPAAAPRTTP